MTEGAGVGGGRDGGLTIGEVVVGAAGTEGGGVDMRGGGGGSSSAGPERMLAKDIGSDLAGFCKKKRKKKSATKYPTRQDKTRQDIQAQAEVEAPASRAVEELVVAAHKQDYLT